MAGITRGSKASVEFCVEWNSAEAAHRDYFYTENVNFWRDCFPEAVYARLQGRESGEHVRLIERSGILPGRYSPQNIHAVKKADFKPDKLINRDIVPRQGRFYPRGIIQGLPGVFQVNMNPCRCIKADGSSLSIDLNHPLSIYPVSVSAVIHDIQQEHAERGGRCEDWLETVTGNGPGMQARHPEVPTDFSGEHAFARKDSRPDREFYSSPRFVYHLDPCARAIVRDIHDRFLHEGGPILDLMASWDSHLDGNFSSSPLTVLGMNREELKANPLAADHVVQDINEGPVLPFQDESFASIVCTSSVEYMTRPYEIFAEAARVLKPGGVCVMTFSNRWFPPKVVSIWEELYEFERLGLVIEYFLRTGSFGEIVSVSYRGRPRPQEDKYYGSLPYADPVFGVIARKNKPRHTIL